MSQPDAFDCKETFRRLGDYLDRELTADEVACVEHHLEMCEECAKEFQFEAALLAHLKAKARASDLPDGLLTRVLQALDDAGEA
ncbi:MAG: zf-HC2 domain-containing protein [Fimbriimonadaceae bacterium]|nr:zf-HC2 domain-containing protein [Chthonomonadaceae bacterium]MCO5297369.1 zf-HC2 domain-containing protein [Fimbriimonadaceae bacterium]